MIQLKASITEMNNQGDGIVLLQASWTWRNPVGVPFTKTEKQTIELQSFIQSIHVRQKHILFITEYRKLYSHYHKSPFYSQFASHSLQAFDSAINELISNQYYI